MIKPWQNLSWTLPSHRSLIRKRSSGNAKEWCRATGTVRKRVGGMIERLANSKAVARLLKKEKRRKQLWRNRRKRSRFRLTPTRCRRTCENAVGVSCLARGTRLKTCDDPRLDKMNPGRLDENKKASSSGRGAYQDDDSAYRQKKNKKTEPAKRTIRGSGNRESI